MCCLSNHRSSIKVALAHTLICEMMIVGISQGFSGGKPFNVRRAADKFLFGFLFLNNGMLMQLTKMGWIKDRDEIDPDADPPLRIAL